MATAIDAIKSEPLKKIAQKSARLDHIMRENSFSTDVKFYLVGVFLAEVAAICKEESQTYAE